MRWKRYPGGVAKAVAGSGLYAKSEDGRFIIFVRRYRKGDEGFREYVNHYSAVDYGIPSGGRRYTNVPILVGGQRTEISSSVERVKAAVEQWAVDHPAENPHTPPGNLSDTEILVGSVVSLASVALGLYTILVAVRQPAAPADPTGDTLNTVGGTAALASLATFL